MPNWWEKLHCLPYVHGSNIHMQGYHQHTLRWEQLGPRDSGWPLSLIASSHTCAPFPYLSACFCSQLHVLLNIIGKRHVDGHSGGTPCSTHYPAPPGKSHGGSVGEQTHTSRGTQVGWKGGRIMGNSGVSGAPQTPEWVVLFTWTYMEPFYV